MCNLTSDIQLPRYGSGDKCRAAFLEKINCLRRHCTQEIGTTSKVADPSYDTFLFIWRRNRDPDLPEPIPIETKAIPSDAVGLPTTLSAELVRPHQVADKSSGEFVGYLGYRVVRANQSVNWGNPYGPLPHAHLIKNKVSLARNLVTIEVRGSGFDLHGRKLPNRYA